MNWITYLFKKEKRHQKIIKSEIENSFQIISDALDSGKIKDVVFLKYLKKYKEIKKHLDQ